MDVVVIIVVLGGLVVLFLKRFERFVYYIAIMDIFLRIMSFIGNNIPVDFIKDFCNKVFPNGIGAIIRNYSSGIFETVLLWSVVIIYGFFLFYLISHFFRKK